MTLEKLSLAFTLISEKWLVRYVISTLLHLGHLFENFPSLVHLLVLVFVEISQLKLVHVVFSFHADVSYCCWSTFKRDVYCIHAFKSFGKGHPSNYCWPLCITCTYAEGLMNSFYLCPHVDLWIFCLCLIYFKHNNIINNNYMYNCV